MRGSNDGQPAPVPEAPDGDFDFQGALGKFDKAAEMAKLSIHGDSTGAATAAAVAAPAAAAATGAEAAADEGTSKPQVAKVRCLVRCSRACVAHALEAAGSAWQACGKPVLTKLCGMQAYDKSTSFFDTISSDSGARQYGRMNRDQERKCVVVVPACDLIVVCVVLTRRCWLLWVAVGCCGQLERTNVRRCRPR